MEDKRKIIAERIKERRLALKLTQKELAKKLNIDFDEKISDEELKNLIENKIDEKDTTISTLESEKDSLSKSNEELTASVDGYKSSEEKLNKELSETKTELTATKGKLEQITGLYKEKFTSDSSEKDQNTKTEKELENDVLAQILNAK